MSRNASAAEACPTPKVSRETSAPEPAAADTENAASAARDIGGLSAESESVTVTRPPALLDLGCLDPTTPVVRFPSGGRPLRAPTSITREVGISHDGRSDITPGDKSEPAGPADAQWDTTRCAMINRHPAGHDQARRRSAHHREQDVAGAVPAGPMAIGGGMAIRVYVRRPHRVNRGHVSRETAAARPAGGAPTSASCRSVEPLF